MTYLIYFFELTHLTTRNQAETPVKKSKGMLQTTSHEDSSRK